MADENRELIEAMEELRRSMGGLALTAEELEEAQKKAAVGMKAFDKASKKAGGDIAKGLGSFAKGVADGDTSLKSLNTVVDTASGALAAMAKTIPFAGDALAAGVKAVGEASKFVINQLDATAKVFNDFSKVGALGTKGMSGVFEQFNRSGMSLQSFNKAVADNAQTLARFRGMTADGAEDFSKVVGGIVDSDAGMELRRIGLSADQIGESTGAFVAQQTRLGRSQLMTQQQLTNGTVQYVKELDELSKVTGLSREAIQKQQDAALSESRFRANYESLMAQGKEKEAKALMAFQSQMQAIGPELGQAVRDLASGGAFTDASRKLLTSTGGAAQNIVDKLKSGQIDQYEAAKQLQAASRTVGDAARENAKYVDKSNSAFIDFSQQMDLNNAQMVEGRGLVKKVQNEQTKGGDKMTDATVSAQQNLEQMNRQIAQLGFQLMPSAAKAIEGFTGSLNEFIGWMGKKIGIEMPGTTKTGAAAARQNQVTASQGSTAEMITGGATASLSPTEMTAGLKLKSSEAVAGGESSEALYGLAHRIQAALGGDLKYFSGLNDTGRTGNSKHKAGLALDVVLNDPEKYAEALSTIKGMPGVSFAQYERAGQVNANGSVASGDHIHAEVSARNGGILSGPSSGYKPNLTMHGTEAVVPLPDGRSIPVTGGGDTGIMQAQLAKLEELVSVMKTQTSLTSKIIQLQA